MQQRLPTVMVLRYIDRNGNTRASSLRALDTTSIPEDHKLTHVDGNPARPGLFVGQLMRSRYNRELVLPVAMNLTTAAPADRTAGGRTEGGDLL
jgi:hypothetical protein